MTDYDLAAAWTQTDLFRSLGKRPLRALVKSTSVVHHPAGKAVVDQGGGGVAFHLVLDGTAGVQVGQASRPDLGPGDYFGEIAVIDGKPRTAKVTAKSDLVTASLAVWDARALFAEEPDVMWALLQGLCARLRAAETRQATAAARA